MAIFNSYVSLPEGIKKMVSEKVAALPNETIDTSHHIFANRMRHAKNVSKLQRSMPTPGMSKLSDELRRPAALRWLEGWTQF